MANGYKQIRLFSNLYKSQQQNEKSKSVFRVIDHDLLDHLDEKPDRCVIYHAYHGDIKTKDYYHTSRGKYIHISYQIFGRIIFYLFEIESIIISNTKK